MTKKSLLAKELKIRKEGINAMLTKVDGYLVDKSFNSDDILDDWSYGHRILDNLYNDGYTVMLHGDPIKSR